MLVWLTLIAGSAVILSGVLLVIKVDQRWRKAHLQCCRCLEVWFSREKVCPGCGTTGKEYDWAARKFAGFPTHDWQGYLDTGPIPIVSAPPLPITVPAPREPDEGQVPVPLPRSGSAPVPHAARAER